MKTSVIVKRNLSGYEIRQDSKTEMFNANDLIEVFNKKTGEKKRIEPFLRNESTQEYIETLIKDLNHNNNNSCYFEKDVVKAKRGKDGGTWMHPYLFIDFAMWLSPTFKLTCIKWIHDKLIKNRINCGDGNKLVNAALSQNCSLHYNMYKDEADMLNKLVFGQVGRGQRDGADEDELDLMDKLQKADIKLIQKGFNYSQRLDQLGKLKELII